MSEKTLKRLLAALAVVVVLWVIASLASGRGGRGPEGAGGLASFFDGVSRETVSRVKILGLQDTLTLERNGSRWTVNGYRADSGSVARFWEGLEEADVGDLVAANPANHERMGVSEEKAWKLEVEVGGETRTLLVGDPGAQYATAYVRLPDSDEVYLLGGNVRSAMSRNLTDWRDKRMAAVDTSQVQRVEVEAEAESYALVRQDSLWTLEGGDVADSTTVTRMLGEMARLSASGFYEESDTLPELGTRVTALGAGGDTLFYLEMGKGEGDRWARVAGDSVLYRLPSWRVTRLAPKKEDVAGGDS